MHRILVAFSFLVLLSTQSFSTGVAVVDATKGIYLHLDTSHVSVKVDGQVARITAYFVFRNTDTVGADILFAFPMPNAANATGLRFRAGDTWVNASLVAQAQDSTVPSSGPTIDPNFVTYVGAVPLFFDIPGTVAPDSIIAIELQYVELLPYELGLVIFNYPASYSLIQKTPVSDELLLFLIESQRTIDTIFCTSHLSAQSTLTPHQASIWLKRSFQQMDKNYQVNYRLNSNELGLWGYSTFLDSTCDQKGNGVLLFIAEPDARESVEAIDKYFTLVIDRSGSMSGSKITQARDAASFIVNNLNIGDQFNIIDFDDRITSFRPSHVPYTIANKNDALKFISNLTADGATNIYDALITAINQFPVSDPTRAHIIIFFTDGLPTAGTTSEDAICNDVKLRNAGKSIILFCFGIGPDVNRRLLTRLADENSGLVNFLDVKDLYTEISNFYLKVRNPVLLNANVTFSPPVVSEIYPRKLPNLYKGQQLLVSGRYEQPVKPLQITLDGVAYGNPVTYTYQLDLADTETSYSFLPKVWAKMKIEDLLISYNILASGSTQQDSIKNETVATSLCFNVASPFTSFRVKWDNNLNQDTDTSGGGQASSVEHHSNSVEEVKTIVATPNPFYVNTTFTLNVFSETFESVDIYIYDCTGRLISVLTCIIDGQGIYRVMWDGRDIDGKEAPSGAYTCIVNIADELHIGRFIKY